MKLPPTCVYDLREAKDCLAFYQQHLRLRDWQITVKIVKKKDGLDHAYAADIDFRIYKKTATIRLMCEEDYDVDSVPQDHEFSLVHELVHLHYAPLEPLLDKCAPLSDVLLEQAVNALAGAIVSMRRNEDVYCGIQEVSDSGNDLSDAGSRGEICERVGRGQEESRGRISRPRGGPRNWSSVWRDGLRELCPEIPGRGEAGPFKLFA